MGEHPGSPRILVAIDPTKNPFDPLRLGGKLARRTKVPVVLVTLPRAERLPHQVARSPLDVMLGLCEHRQPCA